MKILPQLTIIILICYAAEIISALLPFNLPKGVSAMIIIFLALLTGLLKETQISEVANFFMKNMGIFFIPSTIAVVDSSQALLNNLFIIVFICFLTFIITFLAACYSVKAIMLLQEKLKGDKK